MPIVTKELIYYFIVVKFLLTGFLRSISPRYIFLLISALHHVIKSLLKDQILAKYSAKRSLTFT